MRNLTRIFFAVGVVLSVAPSSGWAIDCFSDAPYMTEARSWHFDNVSTRPVTFTVAARDKGPNNCSDRLIMRTPLGLPSGASFTTQGGGTEEVAGLIRLTPSMTAAGTYNVVYTVTDSVGNTTSVSLPLTIGSWNTTPTLDPISDMIVPVGQTISFVIGLSDPDPYALAYTSSSTLVADGLPGQVNKEPVYPLTYNRVAYRITFTPTTYNRGTYRVNIRGRDQNGAIAIAQMRVIVP